MEEKKRKTPSIRFQYYSDDWEQRKLDKVLHERKLRKKISRETPLLAFAAGQGVIDRSERKTNNRDFLTKDSSTKTYLFTKYDDIVYNPSNLKYGAIDRNKYGEGVISPIYVTFETEEVSSFIELIVRGDSFKQRALQYEEGTVTKRQSVKPESLLSLNITLPISKKEQQRIGDFFKQLDNTIALHQSKLELLKNSKQTLLQKMFPKSGESIPELRFPGFTEDWEQRKLEDISDKVTEKNKNNEFTETLTNSAEFGIINQREFFDKDISNEKNLNGYYIVREDDFVYNPRISNYAPVGPIKRNKLGRTGVMSPLYYVFRPHDIDKKFLEYFFGTTIWHKFMKLNGDSGARADRFAIKDSVFKTMPIPYPSIEEQKKVGKFFDDLNDTIALHQQELVILKQLKQTLLNELFI